MTTQATALPSNLPPPQRWFRLRKWLIRLFWTGVFLSVATAIWALWYVNHRGFTRKWRRMVMEELQKRGIHAHISRLTLNPLRGLVAKDVRIHPPREGGWTLAHLDEVTLNIDYSGLVHGRQFVKAVDLRGARISLPLNPADRKGEQLEISGLNARVAFPPNKVEFDAAALIHGVRVTASGRLLNPGAAAAAAKANGTAPGSSRLVLRAILRAFRDLEISGGRPELALELRGDLAAPEGLILGATLRSGRFTVDGGYEVRSARIAASYTDGLLRLDQCAISDRLGELDASGTFRPESGEVGLRLRSTLDLQGLIHALRLSRKADEFAFYAPPTLELSAEATLARTPGEGGPPLRGKAIGKFSVGRFSARSVMFEEAGVEFSWNDGSWYVRDARLAHRSGVLTLSAMRVPDAFRFSLESGLDPKVLLPLLPGESQAATKILREWEFTDPPRFHFEGHAPAPGLEGMEATGEVAFGASRFRGVGFDSLTSHVVLKGGMLEFPDFAVSRPEGKASGAFSFDLQREIATLTGVKSTLTPVDVGVWVDRKGDLPRNLAPYRFRSSPVLDLDGSVQVHGDDATNLRIGVNGKDLDYTFLGKELFFPKIKGTLRLIGKRLKIEGLEGSIFGGKVFGGADISLQRTKGDFQGEARVEEIDFPALTKLYFNYDASRGKLQGHYRFAGRGEDVRKLSGSGDLSISEGNVFGIPLFGPLSGIFDRVLPGVGYNNAREASARFDMKDGVIHTDDLAVKGTGFSMYGNGKLFFLDDKIDFNVRINVQGPAGLLFSPVSHLLEYTADGSLSKPVWRPKRLPKAMFR